GGDHRGVERDRAGGGGGLRQGGRLRRRRGPARGAPGRGGGRVRAAGRAGPGGAHRRHRRGGGAGAGPARGRGLRADRRLGQQRGGGNLRPVRGHAVRRLSGGDRDRPVRVHPWGAGGAAGLPKAGRGAADQRRVGGVHDPDALRRRLRDRQAWGARAGREPAAGTRAGRHEDDPRHHAAARDDRHAVLRARRQLLGAQGEGDAARLPGGAGRQGDRRAGDGEEAATGGPRRERRAPDDGSVPDVAGGGRAGDGDDGRPAAPGQGARAGNIGQRAAPDGVGDGGERRLEGGGADPAAPGAGARAGGGAGRAGLAAARAAGDDGADPADRPVRGRAGREVREVREDDDRVGRVGRVESVAGPGVGGVVGPPWRQAGRGNGRRSEAGAVARSAAAVL
ncbi:MAG: hypothetical protein AVDCRST_MAG49-2584, partial [uncultured Thermomicrobiales bacterium]